jgi:hypothetical protein
MQRAWLPVCMGSKRKTEGVVIGMGKQRVCLEGMVIAVGEQGVVIE